jgi:hypothetical protein
MFGNHSGQTIVASPGRISHDYGDNFPLVIWRCQSSILDIKAEEKETRNAQWKKDRSAHFSLLYFVSLGTIEIVLFAPEKTAMV